MPGSHLVPPLQTPHGAGHSPSGTMSPSCPGAPEPWERALVGMQMDKECRCLGGVQKGWGLGDPSACACPSCLCQVGSRFLHPGRREEGGHGHRQMRHSETNVTSTICCSMRSGGGSAARRRGDGRDSVTLGKGSAAVEQDTNTDHRVPWGQRGGGH